MQVTQSSFAALQRIRSRDHEEPVWIDAICINQNDTNERSAQVRIMKDIFKQATKVIVWLDSGFEHAAAAFRLIERIHSSFGPVEQIPGYPEPSRTFFSGTNASHSSAFREESRSLSLVLKHPWFRRVWVLQEVGLSKKAMVVCGREQIEWSKIVFANAFINAQSSALRNTLSLQSSWIRRMTNKFWHDHNAGFLRLLHLTRTHMASDARDKVFALLSHPCASRIHIDIDYTAPISKTYRDIAVALLRDPHTKNPLDVLSTVFREPSFSRPHLPSWVPDWNTTGRTACLSLDGKDCFSAGRDTQPYFQLRNSDRVLDAEGILFDSVVSQSHHLRMRSFLPGHCGDLDHNYRSPIIDIWNELCSNKQNLYPTGIPSWKAYCDTLTAENFLWYSRGREHPYIPDGNLEHSLALLWNLCSQNGIESLVPAKLSTNHLKSALAATKDEEMSVLFFQEQASMVCRHRRFFITGNGYYGLGPHNMQPQDKLAVLFGAHVPFILRPFGNRWKLVGECYVNGIMHGEAIDMWRKGSLEATVFEIE